MVVKRNRQRRNMKCLSKISRQFLIRNHDDSLRRRHPAAGVRVTWDGPEPRIKEAGQFRCQVRTMIRLRLLELGLPHLLRGHLYRGQNILGMKQLLQSVVYRQCSTSEDRELSKLQLQRNTTTNNRMFRRNPFFGNISPKNHGPMHRLLLVQRIPKHLQLTFKHVMCGSWRIRTLTHRMA